MLIYRFIILFLGTFKDTFTLFKVKETKKHVFLIYFTYSTLPHHLLSSSVLVPVSLKPSF